MSVRQPELTLLILECRHPGVAVLDFVVTALDPRLGLSHLRFGPMPLRAEPIQYFRDFYRDIERVPPDTVGQRILESKGNYLFEEAVPERLQEFLWDHRREIRSVQVQSEESWIPWELCRLSGKEKGRRAEGKFFCEQFVVTRWIPGIPLRPNLKLGDMAIVAPTDPSWEIERQAIEAVADGRWGVERVPANYVEVCNAFASGRFSSWHISGHGGDTRSADPDLSRIFLDDGQMLTPANISGLARNLGDSTPLIFLNACQGARGGLSLTGTGGWATRFLRAGAGAFITSYMWPYNKPAGEFARSFYENLAGGQNIGEAVQAARAKIARAGDATHLAYTLYAHPFASVRLK